MPHPELCELLVQEVSEKTTSDPKEEEHREICQ
eukprot:CAMPEP_0177670436 /NCGR_PEP_ID=MMETSP0447-20121125/24085_1 /TAXON_ID=0 /ORGANISM="Stygamoeba regulata, Strain BSH-02190019" /LENGTH=32 /DNA_ID= /DNA_START= /DNA_END= /DNA_ORIENTATION=